MSQRCFVWRIVCFVWQHKSTTFFRTFGMNLLLNQKSSLLILHEWLNVQRICRLQKGHCSISQRYIHRRMILCQSICSALCSLCFSFMVCNFVSFCAIIVECMADILSSDSSILSFHFLGRILSQLECVLFCFSMEQSIFQT